MRFCTKQEINLSTCLFAHCLLGGLQAALQCDVGAMNPQHRPIMQAWRWVTLRMVQNRVNLFTRQRRKDNGLRKDQTFESAADELAQNLLGDAAVRVGQVPEKVKCQRKEHCAVADAVVR